MQRVEKSLQAISEKLPLQQKIVFKEIFMPKDLIRYGLPTSVSLPLLIQRSI